MKQYCFYQNYREIQTSRNSLQRNPLRPGFSSGSASERTQGSWVRRHRLSLLYHPGWRAAPLPAGEPDRGTRFGLERSQSGYLLRGRTG